MKKNFLIARAVLVVIVMFILVPAVNAVSESNNLQGSMSQSQKALSLLNTSKNESGNTYIADSQSKSVVNAAIESNTLRGSMFRIRVLSLQNEVKNGNGSILATESQDSLTGKSFSENFLSLSAGNNEKISFCIRPDGLSKHLCHESERNRPDSPNLKFSG